jgi:hypothetical protein
MTPGYDL